MNTFFRLLIVAGLAIFTSAYTTTETPAEISKQLTFPVTGNKARVGSIWGDERDGGKRKHEGIDIFAAKGTPVVALSDGYIDVVRNDEIGGNNITLQPDDFTWNAYYAHLDQVYVQVGQWVSKGQLIGTVGNTGNAKTTPPHLHFGIYTPSGAIDPSPYIKSSSRISAPLPPSSSKPTSRKTTNSKPSSAKSKTGSGRNKTIRNSPVGTAVKNAAVQIVTGEILRQIKIRL